MSSVRFLLVLLVVVACTAPEPVVSGEFGGRLMGLTASTRGAQFRLACGQIATPPLRKDMSGTARVSGVANFVGAGSTPMSVEVEVLILRSDHLIATVTFPSGSSEVFELHRGLPPDFSGVGCLASHYARFDEAAA